MGLLFLLALAGCTPKQETPQTPPQTPPEVTQPSAALEHAFLKGEVLDPAAIMAAYRSDPEDTAQKMSQLYVDALQSDLELTGNEGALEVLDPLFDRETLTAENLRPAEFMPDTYEADLLGTGPKGQRRVTFLIVFQDDQPRYHNPLTYYGKQSRRTTEVYLDLLAQGDPEKLSKWLSIDGDGADFLEEASQLLSHYAAYDLSSYQILDFDYSAELQRFIYQIQDGKNQGFELLLLYGDGFVMPDLQAVLK